MGQGRGERPLKASRSGDVQAYLGTVMWRIRRAVVSDYGR